jgi:hypothetical protein
LAPASKHAGQNESNSSSGPLTFRHWQKAKQMAGFHAPFVDSPKCAGFTLSGLWGAPSEMRDLRVAPQRPARRTHAMTQISAVVRVVREPFAASLFQESRDPDAAGARTHPVATNR